MAEEQPKWQPFLDLYDIWAGECYYDADGRQFLQDSPSGVRLAVQEPEKIGPFFQREQPWEAMHIGLICIIAEEGRYRMWYSASPDPDDPDLPPDHLPGSTGNPEYICYAESEDGLNWERPNLEMCAYGGSTATNILFPAGHFGLQYLFRDPNGTEAEKYKALEVHTEWRLDGKPGGKKDAREFRAKLRAEGVADPDKTGRIEVIHMLRGAVSADGLRWTILEEPLLTDRHGLDTQNIIAYDRDAKIYRAYLRDHVRRRRALRYSASAEFHRGWSEPHTVLVTDSQDPIDEDIYNSAYCRYPTGSHHLMFPSIYHRASDVVDIQLAVSRDGLNWTHPERRPIIDRSIGDGEGGRTFGTIYAAPGLLSVGEDYWTVAYSAYQRNHNEWNWAEHRPVAPDGEYWWAKWKRDRLVALEAPVNGKVTLVERPCSGTQLLANFRTESGGWLQFELTSQIPNRGRVEETPPIPGFSFDECDALQGDSLERAVAWKGKDDLSGLKGKEVVVRVRMVRAKLFAVGL